MACSSAPSLSVQAALLLSLGIALVLPQLVVCVATMTHSKGPQNFDSSLSTPTLSYEYEVFVSFHGADTRTSFTAYLFAALDRKRIVAYRDDRNLPRGEEIRPELLKAIETSRIAVVVFSKNYATSDWCLDELVKIMECKRVFNQSVLPIFYNVSQSVVLEQKGVFAEALLNGPVDKVNNWRTAMTEAANLAGFHLEHRDMESSHFWHVNSWSTLKVYLTQIFGCSNSNKMISMITMWFLSTKENSGQNYNIFQLFSVK
ncbi:disease resistance protein RPV1 isoform X2 [Quercus suber]|uniref:disease resistance protein RPV1 isoform X2 n=1 Tax=Quercus suber TaxID=58331 RepID=UPI0032DF9416